MPDRTVSPVALMRALALALVASAALAGSARADDGAETLTAAQAGFLASAPRPSEPTPPRICLLDEGVADTPDTGPDVVPVRKGVVLVDSDGDADVEDQGDPDPDQVHGTKMAAAMVAPDNGFGVQGLAAGLAQVVSVNIDTDPYEPDPQTTEWREEYRVKSDHYKAVGADWCRANAQALNIRVLLLERASYDPPAPELADALTAARDAGLVVVLPAGNDSSEESTYAAQIPAASLVVGASSSSGTACEFSPSGPRIDLDAPGCVADASSGNSYQYGGGTSTASALASAAAAALLSYSPGLSNEQASQLLTSTVTQGPRGAPLLDVADAFRHAGLGDLVAGSLTSASTPAPPAAPASQQQPSVGRQLPSVDQAVQARPRVLSVSFDRRRHRLVAYLAPSPRPDLGYALTPFVIGHRRNGIAAYQASSVRRPKIVRSAYNANSLATVRVVLQNVKQWGELDVQWWHRRVGRRSVIDSQGLAKCHHNSAMNTHDGAGCRSSG